MTIFQKNCILLHKKGFIYQNRRNGVKTEEVMSKKTVSLRKTGVFAEGNRERKRGKKMKNPMHRVSCIQCGHKLLGACPDSEIEMNCPKCKTFLQIAVRSEGVRITLKTAESERP